MTFNNGQRNHSDIVRRVEKENCLAGTYKSVDQSIGKTIDATN